MKVTLSIDDRIVAEARRIAAVRGVSLDQLVCDLLNELTRVDEMEAAVAQLDALRRRRRLPLGSGLDPRGTVPTVTVTILLMQVGRSPVAHADPDVCDGTPVFVGIRVPVTTLFDYLEGGETLERFLDQFPSVSRDQALAALDIARSSVLDSARSA